MTARAIDRLVETLSQNSGLVKPLSEDRYTAQCPGHDDTNPSLSIKLRDNGDGVVLHCHAGCQTADIIAALGWHMRDLFDDPKKRAAYSDRNTYTYRVPNLAPRAPSGHRATIAEISPADDVAVPQSDPTPSGCTFVIPTPPVHAGASHPATGVGQGSAPA